MHKVYTEIWIISGKLQLSNLEPPQCEHLELTCRDGSCIDARRKCDGYPDCSDHSDESQCPQTCSDSEFTCDDGSCIDVRRKCDAHPDCPDQSDEHGCPEGTKTQKKSFTPGFVWS